MASIADIHFTADLDDSRLQVDAKRAGDKAGTTMGKGISGSIKKSLSGSKGALLGGLGLGVGLGGIGVATAAVGKLTDVMGEAVAAAIEEEASISKLDTALRANVKGYDGNTDAIEKVLAARMRLGFADDEQRQSLALLVAATNDETKALELQRTAMDLARLKGISLKEASEALIKVDSGQFRALKALGIQLPKNATATEALAAVQRIAAGQAEAFAKTSQGKLLVSQVKVGEAMEKIGAVIMPLVVDATVAVADVLGRLIAAFEGVGDAAKDNSDPIVNFANILHDVFKDEEKPARTFLGSLFDGLNDVARGTNELGRNINDAVIFWDGYTDAAEDTRLANEQITETARETGRGLVLMGAAAADAEEPITELGERGESAGVKLAKAARAASKAFRDYRDQVIGYARDIVDRAYQIIEDKAELTAANVEAAELRKAIATGKATADQKAQYEDLTQTQIDLVLDLAANGVIASKEVNTALAALREKLKTAVGLERTAILAVLTAMNQLTSAAEKARASIATVKSYGLNLPGADGRAHGGPVQANKPYWVGELGPELIVPRSAATVIPSDRSMALTAAPSGGTTNVNVRMDAAPAARDPFEVARQLRRLADFGVLRLSDG